MKASPVDHFKVTMTVRVPVWLRKEIDRQVAPDSSINSLVVEALCAHLEIEAPA